MPEGAERELEHQRQRLCQRRAEAIGIGQLDVTEVSTEESEAAHASHARQDKLGGRVIAITREPAAWHSQAPPPSADEVLSSMACYVAGAHLLNPLPWSTRHRVRCVENLAEAAVAVAQSVVLTDISSRPQLVV